jgi:predicted permease
MLQLAWIFVWITVGFALKRLAGARLFVSLNRFIIWFSLPATILLALHKLQWDASYWIPISMAWILFACGVAVFVAIGTFYNWSRGTIGALILTAGLGNTSFIGFPLLRALYGENALKIAILNDQPGSFLVLSTVGIYAASFFSARRSSLRSLLARILRFPPVWATLLGLASRSFALPAPSELILGWGTQSLIPLALISVGGQLDLSRSQFERELSPVAWGLGYKLILAPLLLLALYVGILHQHGEAIRITLLEAAMGPMITGAIVAREYELDPSLCSLMVSVGIPLCLITVPLWAKLLEMIGV